jgi:hypothetical protein
MGARTDWDKVNESWLLWVYGSSGFFAADRGKKGGGKSRDRLMFCWAIILQVCM